MCDASRTSPPVQEGTFAQSHRPLDREDPERPQTPAASRDRRPVRRLVSRVPVSNRRHVACRGCREPPGIAGCVQDRGGDGAVTPHLTDGRHRRSTAASAARSMPPRPRGRLVDQTPGRCRRCAPARRWRPSRSRLSAPRKVGPVCSSPPRSPAGRVALRISGSFPRVGGGYTPASRGTSGGQSVPSSKPGWGPRALGSSSSTTMPSGVSSPSVSTTIVK